MMLVASSPAKASGTSKRDEATSIRLPMPLLPATVSATIEPTNANVMATLSEGPEHPSTNRGRRNFARLLLADGDAEEALRFSEVALSAHEKVLGRNHRWTKESACVAADALAGLGRAEEASALRGRYDVLQFGFDQTSNDTQLLRT